ncbi:MAG: MFS transporter [Betaproteobacteria bacterium]|nr:MFS transporter [Betaproteobacteria bacterium]MDE2210267.1 MFS transporter [Betaproteobacteria bacterium]
MTRKPSMFVVFLTVFIDLIGFGIVVPLVPMYSRHYGASGWLIGAIIASFSAMQFVFSPIWGRLSDRHGRRPILLVSTFGAALSYVLFAIGSGFESHALALGMLLLSRILAGACGGNITVAQAYIADITPPQHRSKRMGLIGMAFGLGFIFGPAISGVALNLGGPTAPGWAAAALCAANFVLAYFILAESLKPDSGDASNRPRLEQWAHTLSQPGVGVLILLFFLATFAFTCFESTLPLLVSDNFNLGLMVNETAPATTVVSLFVFCGLIGALVQGGAIGWLVKKLGEPKLIASSLLFTGIALTLLPFVKGEGVLAWSAVLQATDWPWIEMLLVLALLSIGSALTRAPLFGLLSNLTPANEQGATLGVAQGAGALARIVGPLFAASLYFQASMLPYVICGAISIAAAGIAALRLAGT